MSSLTNWVREGANLVNVTTSAVNNILTAPTKLFRTLAPPTHSQFAKSVYFLLYDSGRFTGTATKKLVLPINPEDFELTRPERVSVVQTLGAPFVDEFGKGLPRINMRGSTGWRTRIGSGIDGYEAYRQLHREIFDEYFRKREELIDAGRDPDNVRLIIVNNVDNQIFDVVPEQFKLLRSKNMPLLYQYNLDFIVIDDLSELGVYGGILDSIGNFLSWVNMVAQAVKNAANTIENIVDSVISGFSEVYFTVKALTETTNDFVQSTSQMVESLGEDSQAAINIVNSMAAATNTALAAVRESEPYQELPIEVASVLTQIHFALQDIELATSRTKVQSLVPNYEPLQGGGIGATAFSGVKTGAVANTPATNAIQWALELKEFIDRSQYSTLIEFTSLHAEENGFTAYLLPTQGVYLEDDVIHTYGDVGKIAPVVIRGDIGQCLSDVAAISAADINNQTDIFRALTPIDSLFNCFEFHSNRVDKVLAANRSKKENATSVDKFKQYTVSEYETLQTIALKELGSAERWMEIVSANNIIIEDPTKVYLPLQTLSAVTSAASGTNYINFPGRVPSDFLRPEILLQAVSSEGRKQNLRISKIEDIGTYEFSFGAVENSQRVFFHETFSTVFLEPITFTVYENRAVIGLYDYSTVLSVDSINGSKTVQVNSAKDIYQRFILYLQTNSEGRFYTVENVDYITKTVTVDPPVIEFKAGSEIQIFDKEIQRNHLEPGTKLLIPIQSTVANKILQFRPEVFGTDIQLTETGRLAMAGGDLQTVSGLSNLKQAIRHRIVSPYRSIILHPRYGCGIKAIIGEKNGPHFAGLAKATLVDALNNEPRVRQIKDLIVDIHGDILGFSVEVMAIDTNSPTIANFVIEVDNVPA